MLVKTQMFHRIVKFEIEFMSSQTCETAQFHKCVKAKSQEGRYVKKVYEIMPHKPCTVVTFSTKISLDC